MIRPFKYSSIYTVYKVSVPTSQRTQSIPFVKTNCLLLFGALNGVHCDDRKKRINIVCARMQKFSTSTIFLYYNIILVNSILSLIYFIYTMTDKPHNNPVCVFEYC